MLYSSHSTLTSRVYFWLHAGIQDTAWKLDKVKNFPKPKKSKSKRRHSRLNIKNQTRVKHPSPTHHSLHVSCCSVSFTTFLLTPIMYSVARQQNQTKTSAHVILTIYLPISVSADSTSWSKNASRTN
ncbi:hypothetical protein M438DRAFT_43489 [Aureobasidium pullulans EXF-150]|uniref:Uncharacterized protein n=1 Tax=Aureobasidium pullulans EXF-150 TaxID=1043002 RepID=A0A074XCH7_AURPU|nr:uncharacterized protein M438DRAFT_43489 [Aureobasidium pullulans EXF-150]KEQ83200.1 hypothetical protein M438DRAFT_43489 [Aureobasidium pullulans EXF-150]